MADTEKVEFQQDEKLDRIPTEHSTPSQERLKQVETLAKVDILNHQAWKGDDSDGKFSWHWRQWLAAGFLAMLYTGSQILLYFTGGSLSYIAADIGSQAAIGWLPVANTLAIASICPFVGYMQDLFGKRYIAIFGACLLVIGCSVMGTAHDLGHALVGQGFAGAGAGIGELTGLAGLAETVPVKRRGFSLAILTAFIVPFCPYVLYSQLLASHATWRWGAWISLIYNATTAVGLLLTYFPHAHTRAEGMSKKAIIRRIDWTGGFLSITGLALFLVALQAGGYTHPWTSAYVLCTFLIGFALLVTWFIYEWKFCKWPMIPGELFTGQKVVGFAFGVAFVAGMNFFSLLNFWPLTISTVYAPIPLEIGLRGMSAGFATALGAIFWNALLSVFTNKCKWVLFAAATMLTCFGGALSVMTPDNVVTTIALGTLACWGLGGVIVPAATVAMIAAPDALITTCAAVSLSVRAVGGSIGYSIYFNVFSEKLKHKLPLSVLEYSERAGLTGSPTYIKTFIETYLGLGATEAAKIPGITPAILDGALKGSEWAYAESLHYVWYTSIAFGVCAMICASLIPDMRRFQTNRIAVELS